MEGYVRCVLTMFEAFVLVCLISNPTLCHTLQDIEGPYSSRKVCTQRAYEIASELPSYLPMYIPKQYMCMEQPKGTRI